MIIWRSRQALIVTPLLVALLLCHVAFGQESPFESANDSDPDQPSQSSDESPSKETNSASDTPADSNPSESDEDRAEIDQESLLKEPVVVIRASRSGHLRLAFSPDGSQLAYGGPYGVLRLVDAATGKRSWPLDGHTAAVRCLVFSRDGKLFASGSSDRTVHIWDPTNGSILSRLRGLSGAVIGLAFAPDGKHLIVGTEDGRVTIWDWEKQIRRNTLNVHAGPLSAITLSPDAKTLVTAGVDKSNADSGPLGEIKFWNVSNTKMRSQLTTGASQIVDLEFSPDGKTLAAVLVNQDKSRSLKLWDTKTEKPLPEFKQFDGDVESIAFSTSNNQLAAGLSHGDENVGTIIFLNLKGQNPIRKIEHKLGGVHSVAVSSNAERFATSSDVGTVSIWALTEKAHAAAQSKEAQGPQMSGLVFDGADDYVVVPHIPLDQFAAFTIEVWTKGWKQAILCQGLAGDPENSIWMSFGNKANQGVAHESCGWENGNGDNHEFALFPVDPDDWVHLAMVFDGKTQSIYMNGRLIDSQPAPKPGPLESNRLLVLGAHYYQQPFFGSGELGPLRISKVARYDKEFQPKTDWKPDEDTELLYSLSEGRGDRLEDRSDHKRHGTITGATWSTPSSSEVVQLVEPKANAAVATTGSRIVWDFQWDPVKGAEEYDLYIKHVRAPNPHLQTRVHGTKYHHDVRGSISSKYREGWTWRVRAIRDGKELPWSETRSFRAAPAPP